MNNCTMKRCTKCGEEKPLTSEYFQWRNDRQKFDMPCKSCRANQVRKWFERPDVQERSRQSCRRYYYRNQEYMKQRARDYNRALRQNPEKAAIAREKDRQRNINSPKRREDNKRRSKAWAQIPKNKERIAELRRKHMQDPRKRPAILLRNRLKTQRRRAREFALPDTFTEKDWQYALDYFNHRCAICGNQLRDLFGTQKPAADHWIPLTHPDCPGTVPGNMLPMCQGLGGCNNAKSNIHPVEWLNRRYSKAKAKQILARIQEYFNSIS